MSFIVYKYYTTTWNSSHLFVCPPLFHNIFVIKSCHGPSSIYSWFINLRFLLHSKFKSWVVAYFQPKMKSKKSLFFGNESWKTTFKSSQENLQSFFLLPWAAQTAFSEQFMFKIWFIDQLYINLGPWPFVWYQDDEKYCMLWLQYLIHIKRIPGENVT